VSDATDAENRAHLPAHVLPAFPVRAADAAPPAWDGLQAEESGRGELLQKQLRPSFSARELLVSGHEPRLTGSAPRSHCPCPSPRCYPRRTQRPISTTLPETCRRERPLCRDPRVAQTQVEVDRRESRGAQRLAGRPLNGPFVVIADSPRVVGCVVDDGYEVMSSSMFMLCVSLREVIPAPGKSRQNSFNRRCRSRNRMTESAI